MEEITRLKQRLAQKRAERRKIVTENERLDTFVQATLERLDFEIAELRKEIRALEGGIGFHNFQCLPKA